MLPKLLTAIALFHTPRSTGPTTYANARAKRGMGSLADKPHFHTREIARRKRQAERVAANRASRGGLSRRGNPVVS